MLIDVTKETEVLYYCDIKWTKWIYLAARYARLDEMRGYAKKIEETTPYLVNAQWIYGKEEGQDKTNVACMDFDDVKKCDILICFTDPFGSSQTGGGRHTELGMALAWEKQVWIVGEREQIFHWLPQIRHFETFEDVLKHLGE